jgi:hypothetical protein
MITIIDSIMGSGKTTYMIDYINKAYSDALGRSFLDPSYQTPRFLYVTPLLSEVDRINAQCPGLNFRDPQPVEGRKLHHLATLIDEGANICTTHALFSMLNRAIYEKLREQNYILVIDEVLDCVHMFEGLSRSDRELLFKDGLVYLETGTRRLRWNHRDHKGYSGKFNSIRHLCDNGNLVLYRDTALLWEFPTDFLRCFDQVYVLTYMFFGSAMSAYLRSEGMPFEMTTLRGGQLVSWADHSDETEIKERLRSLIMVYKGPANKCGERRANENPFSSGWYDKRSPEELARIKGTVEYWFKRFAETPAEDNAWTTYAKARKSLKGARYSRKDCWIPNNAKATNDHRHKKSLAYLCNVFHNPLIKGYFEDRGITIYQDLHALSEMVQWIWRSQIRDVQPINVFIPSERMRSLFIEWLDSVHVISLIESEFRQAA